MRSPRMHDRIRSTSFHETGTRPTTVNMHEEPDRTSIFFFFSSSRFFQFAASDDTTVPPFFYTRAPRFICDLLVKLHQENILEGKPSRRAANRRFVSTFSFLATGASARDCLNCDRTNVGSYRTVSKEKMEITVLDLETETLYKSRSGVTDAGLLFLFSEFEKEIIRRHGCGSIEIVENVPRLLRN